MSKEFFKDKQWKEIISISNHEDDKTIVFQLGYEQPSTKEA